MKIKNLVMSVLYENLIKNLHCMQSLTHPDRVTYEMQKLEMELFMDGNDIPEKTYQDLKKIPSSLNHWGQLKLLLSEIQFLTPYKHVSELCVVYIGCSPGHHLKLLVELMPKTWHWRLYDCGVCEVFCNKKEQKLFRKKCCAPNKLKSDSRIQEKNHEVTINREIVKNVTVYQFNMTLNEAKIIHNKYVRRVQSDDDPQLLCISDLRTGTSEEKVNTDMVFQKALIETLRPYQASLKFKLPYSGEYERYFTYLDGNLFFQSFKPPVSHECRLFTFRGDSLKNTKIYDTVEYMKKNYRFQTVQRIGLYMDDQLPNEIEHPSLIKYGVASDHCYDCTCAKEIIKKYLNDKNSDVLALLETLVSSLSKIQIECKA